MPEFLEWPEAASTTSREVDRLFAFSLVVAAFFSLLIAVLIVYFGVKYRRRTATPEDRGEAVRVPRNIEPAWLEITWSAIPLGIVLLLFFWGAKVFFEQARPPADAEEYTVIGRQWMWKVQHPEGTSEINELHVPEGRAVKLTMTSEDVIHSFYVPAFRMKMDVLPGRYTTAWFRATKAGVYHLFCAEYCGTEHSGMIGRVVVLTPFEYEKWLEGARDRSPVMAKGEDVFRMRGCPTCHRPDTAARGPILNGLLGREVRLASGETIVADEAYIRESILRPRAKLVAGHEPLMPAYEGRISEEEVLALVGYVRSLSPEGGAGGEVR